ncbi:WD40/YVTN/BNR-like repeat-containing protein [Chloroflexota bacterium]
MKKRINKLLGIGLVVIVLVSLFGFAAPASAGTLSWSDKDIPDDSGKVVIPSTDISDFDISGDGEIIYAADSESGRLYRSSNGGKTWSTVDLPSGATDPQLVAVAPDNASVMAIVADDNEVYVTTNAGATWKTALATVLEGTAAPALIIYDIALSPEKSGDNYIAVAGIEDTNGNGSLDAATDIANVWYYNLGVGGYWHETNDRDGWHTSATTGVEMANVSMAVAFSPNFNSDSVLLAVIASYDGGSLTDEVTFEIFSTSTSLWNNAAGFGSSYPVVIATDDGITGLSSASLGLAPTYLGSDDAERIGFVGLTIEGDVDATSKSGIVRLKNTSDKLIREDYEIHSVAYDGANLVAGRYNSNIVDRTDEALVTTPTFTTTRSLKRPGIDTTGVDEKTKVAWAGSNVVAGTQGNESAFAISTNNGMSFNDVSLIDTAFTSIEDVAVSADGSKIYLITQDVNDLSVWRYASDWVRVLAVANATGYIARAAPDDADVVYIAKTGAKSIYYTQDGGESKWFTRTAKYDLQDLTVESADVAYIALDSAKNVSKTTNGGFTWGTSKDTILSGGDIHTIVSLSEDNVIVGSTTGYVSYSTNGGSNWTNIEKQMESGALLTQVAASGLADGDYIYTASSEAGTSVRRWEIGSSTAWKNLEATTDATYGASGMVLVSGVLYVQTESGTDSATLRTLSPTVSTPLSSYWSTMADTTVLDRTPSALRASTGSITLWGIDTEASTLEYYKDILAESGPTLASPADGIKVSVNPITGKSYDVAFVWEQPPKGRSYKYDLWIAFDSSFKETAVKATESSSSASPSHIIGPGGTDGGGSDSTKLEYMPGRTYHWKVRVATDEPLKSPWSEPRKFSVEPGVAAVPKTLSPSNGATGITQTPSFSWDPVSGATEYRFKLAQNVALDAPLVDVRVKSTGFAIVLELDLDTAYYWSVKPVSPVEGDWSAIANFTVKGAPAPPAPPPIVVKEMPAPVINIPAAPPPPPAIVIPPAPAPPAPITPGYIWAIIIIGAVLVIAVIVLIIRTRRAV